VRIGDSRDDGCVIGFFVDDDFAASMSWTRSGDPRSTPGADEAARYFGTTLQVPAVRPIEHPYAVAEIIDGAARPDRPADAAQHPAECHHVRILPRKSFNSRDRSMTD
jgi:hypothetical protein